METDTFTTATGKHVAITFIKHGTLMIDADGYVFHIDPVTMFGTDYSRLPKADCVLVTHEHGDHYDAKAIDIVTKEDTRFLSNGRVAELSQRSEAMKPGDTLALADGKITLTATAAYNTTPGHEQFHPKGRDVGFLIDFDGLRIYVAGDTEDIPELASLKDVDIAFLPVNQPYTMTPAQCINAAAMFRPKVFYPYHYGDTDLSTIAPALSGATEVRIRQLQ